MDKQVMHTENNTKLKCKGWILITEILKNIFK